MHKSNLKLVMEQFLLLSQRVNCRYYACHVKWRQELWTDKDFELGSVLLQYAIMFMWVHLGKLKTSAGVAINPAEIQSCYVPVMSKKKHCYARQLCLQQWAIVLSFCISKLKCAASLIVLGTQEWLCYLLNTILPEIHWHYIHASIWALNLGTDYRNVWGQVGGEWGRGRALLCFTGTCMFGSVWVYRSSWNFTVSTNDKNKKYTRNMLQILYVVFWVIPWHLNFICQSFGTLCSIWVGTYPPVKIHILVFI
jgi:hypothetical protein